MISRKTRTGMIVSAIFGASFLMASCAAPLIPLSLSTLVGGAELALRGGDLYKQMRKADERKAFEMPFHLTWELTLETLTDLSLEISSAAVNENGDGGLIEVKSLHSNFRVAVVEVTEKVSEVGIWAKKDRGLAALIIARIEKEAGPAILNGALTRREDPRSGRAASPWFDQAP